MFEGAKLKNKIKRAKKLKFTNFKLNYLII